MFVLEDPASVRDTAPNAQVLRNIRSMYARLPVHSRLKIFLTGSNHFSFSDQMLLKSQLLLGTMRRLHVIGGLSGARGLAITTDYVTSFFDVYLKDHPRTVLDALPARYSEVRLE